jgi:hypothetical protein
MAATDTPPDIGTAVTLYTRTDMEWLIAPHEMDRVDAAMQAFIDGGKLHDQLLHIERHDGGDLIILVSLLGTLVRSTPETRARDHAAALWYKAEQRQNGILD